MMCNCGSFSNACRCGRHASMSGAEIKEYGNDVLDTVRTGASDIFDAVKSTGGFIAEEAKEGYEAVKEQGQRFDEKERLIKSVPNSYLVFGGIAILLYSLIK